MPIKKLFLAFLISTNLYSFSQDKEMEKIDSILIKAVENNLGPGLTVGVVKDGLLSYIKSRGYMNLEYHLPFNDSTVFDLASVTKQFTSACIAILEKQGKLSIQEDVRKYIPELHYYGDTIRIIHLLNHTSGIRNHNVLLDLMGFDYEHQGYTNKMIQELMFRQNGVNNRPGEKMLYSNTNYVLLALIIERISLMKIHEFAQQELFKPLLMHHTSFRSDLNEIITNTAYPYYSEDALFKQPKSLTLCVGAGGMQSTVHDLSLWAQVFLNPTHKFSFLKDFITELDTLTNGDRMKHARGMFISPYKGHITFNHSGRDVGMRSQFMCFPNLNLAIFVYSNSEDINAVEISYKIADLFIDAPIEKETETMTVNPSIQPSLEITGTYQELNSDLRMTIFIENDTLKAKSSFGRDAVSLKNISPNNFSRFDNPSVTYTFLSENETDLQVDFSGAIFYFEKIELEAYPNQKLEEYVGKYYSPELDVTYHIHVYKNQLILDYPNNNAITLNEGQTDVFGSNRRVKYAFKRTKKGIVTSFYISAEGTVKDILFEKVN